MEDQQFDGLARGLAQAVSRSQVLKAALAAATGGVLARAGLGTALASTSNAAKAACVKACLQTFHGQQAADCVKQALAGGPCLVCGSGGTCNSGFHNCGTNTNCFCFTSSEGTGICGCNTFCNGAQVCTHSTDCPSGYYCAVDNGCTGCSGSSGVCIAICGGSHATCSLNSNSISEHRAGVTALTAISRA